jgi:mRNA interferase MazF
MIEYRKRFDEWNKRKKRIDDSNFVPLFSEREIWWCSIGENIGFEENGKNENFSRPVLILKKYNNDLFIGLAMTSQPKRNRFHYEISPESFVILSQQRALSGKRLIRQISTLSENKFSELIDKLIKLNFRK